MNNEDYKIQIILWIEASKDDDYILALYSFAESYPDKSRDSVNYEE